MEVRFFLCVRLFCCRHIGLSAVGVILKLGSRGENFALKYRLREYNLSFCLERPRYMRENINGHPDAFIEMYTFHETTLMLHFDLFDFIGT